MANIELGRTPETATTDETPFPSVPLARVFAGGIGGSALGGVVNILLYFVGQAAGATYVPNDTSVFPVLPWFQGMIISVLAGVVASLLFALLQKIAKTRAWTIFLVIAAVVFLVYIIFPFRMFTDGMTIAVLQAMHVPTALGILWGIRRELNGAVRR